MMMQFFYFIVKTLYFDEGFNEGKINLQLM